MEARLVNAKEYWKLLKVCAGLKDCIISISMIAEYFSMVSNPQDRFLNVDEDDFVSRYINDEFQMMFHKLNVDIYVDEIEKAIQQLKSGPDLLLNEFFISDINVLIPYLFVVLIVSLKVDGFHSHGQNVLLCQYTRKERSTMLTITEV